jgi:hypothetical protein
MQNKPKDNRPAKIECGNCFYNDGSCKDDPKNCCYLLADKMKPASENQQQTSGGNQ